MSELLTGLTGDGKTLLATERAFSHLDRGGVLGCNYHLKPGWAWRMAKRSYDHTVDGKPLDQVAISFWQRAFLCGKPDSIKQLADIGEKLCIGPVSKQFDRKILLILDEAGLYMGPDKFRENMPWLQMVTQSRKYKIDPLFLAHDPSFIDSKLRKMLKVISQSTNLSEHWRVPGTNLCWPRADWAPWLPRPTFIRKRWSPLSKKVHFTFARYKPWITELYDTDEKFDFDNLPSALEPQGCLGPNIYEVEAAEARAVEEARAARRALPWPVQRLSECIRRTRYA